MTRNIEIRLTKLETVTPDEDKTASPVLIYRPGETLEQAAKRQGMDPKSTIYALPENGRDQ